MHKISDKSYVGVSFAENKLPYLIYLQILLTNYSNYRSNALLSFLTNRKIERNNTKIPPSGKNV